MDTYERIYKKMFAYLGLAGADEKELLIHGKWPSVDLEFFQRQVMGGGGVNNTMDR